MSGGHVVRSADGAVCPSDRHNCLIEGCQSSFSTAAGLRKHTKIHVEQVRERERERHADVVPDAAAAVVRV